MTFDVISHKKVAKSKGGVLVCGFPGVGWLGRSVLEYFIRELKPTLISSVYSSYLPSYVVTKHKGVIHSLKHDLYVLKRKGKQKDLYFLLGDAQPDLQKSPFNAQHLFSRDMIDFVSEQGISDVITIAGLPNEARLTLGPKNSVAVTDEKVFKSLNGNFEKQGPGLPISGCAGLLLQYAALDGMSGACIIGSTGPQGNIPDVTASFEVAKLIVDSFGIKINLKNFAKEAGKFENDLKHAVESASEVSLNKTDSERFRDKYPSYIR